MRLARDEQAWQRARRLVIDRDAGRCRLCGTSAKGDLGDVHHLVPRAAGGTDEPGNLILLCDGCHASRHPRLAVGLARAVLIRWGLSLARLIDREGLLQRDPRALRPILIALGVEQLRPGQLEPILQALRGDDVLLIQPTGSGKSLCFQIPALANPGLTVVISPLRALMDDQVAGLLERGIPATMIHSDVPPLERAARYELLREGAFKLLYVAPERFTRTSPQEQQQLAALRPSFMVVDEAHCIDRWGPAFRPDYANLAAIRASLGRPPVLAFTATAGPESRRRIAASLGIAEDRALVRDADRPNLAICRVALPQSEQGSTGADRPPNSQRVRTLIKLLDDHPEGVRLIFVPTKRIGRALADTLRRRDSDAVFFHAELPAAEKEELLQRAVGRLQPPLRTIVATSAFGMGVDIPDIRLVILWQQPPCVEDLLQQIGRAGRDGKPSLAVVFTDRNQDLSLLEFLAERTLEQTPDERAADRPRLRMAMARDAALLADILDHPTRCVRTALLDATGTTAATRRPLALRIVEFALGLRRSQNASRRVCCDACDAPWAARTLGRPSVAESGRAKSPKPAPRRASTAPSTSRPCDRCGGSGRIDKYRHRDGGRCYACGGTGHRPQRGHR